jgi:hypothetical protein
LLDTVAQRNTLLSSIEKARDSSVIAYILHDNAMIADDAVPQLYDKLQALGRRDRIDLLLYARGGVVEVAWRMLNLLRDYCDHLGVIIGTRVGGAGALLALGADEVIIGPLSELSGMDTARKHPLLPRDDTGQPIPITLGEVDTLLRFISGAGGGESHPADPEARRGTQPLTPQAAPLSAEHLSTLFNYLHPVVIGGLQQANILSRDVTRKALYMHMGPDDEAAVERIVDLFNGGFHSAAYTPNRDELEAAGLPITVAEPDLWGHIWGLVQLYQGTLYNDRQDQHQPGAFSRYVCLIESQGRTTGLRQIFTHVEGQERVVQMGWETAVKGPGPGPSMGPGWLSNN